MDCNDCVLHNECEKRTIDERKRINKRLEAVEDSQKMIYDLITEIKGISINVQNILDKIGNHEKRLDDLESRDGEKWREVVKVIIGGVVGVLIGLVFKGF